MLLRKRKASLEKEAKRLALIIEDYENKHIPMPEPDPIEVINYMMEQSQMSQKQLAEILGNKGNVSKILNKKRRLSIEMIRKLSENLHLPAEILIKEYPSA
ncbi:MAG: helix-turn-helix domain-containing protein [Saprospiraceae bacterium]|nr:helix-turn-helix domain-containing protein [Saprospiraceae bacterium]MBK7372767.1 helix-turn-helix domain-containing protein [Saprospiraceae bacterium]MBK8279738.1 helix-turn-helix domain-containing protein [Saprospiraceae bacterium]MBK8513494.1 helix-turn-helix domain-containing protein [Saprospiraceae bacterium]MBK9680515.1 helix-turn-helix domain-containing protein [Saprospiraceae bacterium]